MGYTQVIETDRQGNIITKAPINGDAISVQLSRTAEETSRLRQLANQPLSEGAVFRVAATAGGKIQLMLKSTMLNGEHYTHL